MPQRESKSTPPIAFTPEEILAAEKESNQCGDRFTTAQLLEQQPSAEKGSEGGYQVLWLPEARSQFKTLAEGNDLEKPVRDVENRLTATPAQIGCELGANHSRIVRSGPLNVLFRVDEGDRLVTIMAVKKDG